MYARSEGLVRCLGMCRNVVIRKQPLSTEKVDEYRQKEATVVVCLYGRYRC